MLSQQAIKKRKKYLAQYAEPIVSDIAKVKFSENTSFSPFHHALVIPAYQESIGFVERLVNSPFAQQNACFVIVVNQPDDEPDKSPQQTLFDQTLNLGEIIFNVGQLTLIQLRASNSAILLVDCFNQGLAEDQGVGLARKIGCDLVIALQEAGLLLCDLFGSSDADAYLPDDYFTRLNTASDLAIKSDTAVSALCFPFIHQFQESDCLTSEQQQVQAATTRYENALHYYVAGLHFANSSYSFYTIGSILAISSTAYVDVRGFVKRSAGEDFYTLNKLAKIGQVKTLSGSPIVLSPRVSTRVPFGTGPAVKEIIALEEQSHDYCYYHYQCFVELKVFLTALERFFVNLTQDNIDDKHADFNHALSAPCQRALIDIGFVSFFQKQRANCQGNINQFKKQVDGWFDAFKTLKFIHSIKAQGYGDIPLEMAIKDAPFTLLADNV